MKITTLKMNYKFTINKKKEIYSFVSGTDEEITAFNKYGKIVKILTKDIKDFTKVRSSE